MDHPQAIEVLVRRVAREVRVRRTEHWGLRGAFWGALVAAAVLAFKAALGLAALAVAPALVALGVIAGATYGFTKRVNIQDGARLADRAFGQRSGTGSGSTAGDLSAIFKDTALSSQRPDFNSFLKKGDERLKLLEQVDRLPDLQSDFTSSQYKMVYRKSKSLLSGLSPDISPRKLRELLDEMERLGRKVGNWSGYATGGNYGLEGGP